LSPEEIGELDKKIAEDIPQDELNQWYQDKGFLQRGRDYIRQQTCEIMEYARADYDGQIEWSAEDAVNTDTHFLLELIYDVITRG